MVDRVWLAYALQNTARRRRGILSLADFWKEADELVAAQAAAHRVAIANAGEQAFGHRLQQLVANGVALRVIDQFEAVEIDIQHRNLAFVAVGQRRWPD